MITNERQYRITKSELETFKSALTRLDAEAAGDREARVHRAALASQVDEFSALVAEYDSLQEAKAEVFQVPTLAELPTALIRARIARRMNQKELAEALGVKEQQVQRWESARYENISFANLQRVIAALGVSVREEVFVPGPEATAPKLLQRLKDAGVPLKLLFDRLVPPELRDAISGKESDEGAVFAFAGLVSKVFGIPLPELLSDRAVNFQFAPVSRARFKAPANANAENLNVYTLYAHYLATLTTQACEHLPLERVPADWKAVRKAILRHGDRVDFKSALRFAWSIGVPVLPLSDPGAFHGAVWRINGRNVIVLKQRKDYPSYWLHDLLHELEHASEAPDQREHTVLEAEPLSPERRTSPEEQAANDYAEDVILGGLSDKIEDECVKEAKGQLPQLKSAIPKVAARYGVDQGYLANYMAVVLAQTKTSDFWGTATNLQPTDYSAFEFAQQLFCERASLHRLNEQDRELLLQGLQRSPDHA
jgi:transcriptional regulator with XRE-family HTH domain